MCLGSFLIPGFAQAQAKFLDPEKSSQAEKKPPFVIIAREHPAYTVFNVSVIQPSLEVFAVAMAYQPVEKLP